MTPAEPAAIERLRAALEARGTNTMVYLTDWTDEVRALLAVADAAKVLDGNLDRYEHADSKLWGQLEDLSAALDALEAPP